MQRVVEMHVELAAAAMQVPAAAVQAGVRLQAFDAGERVEAFQERAVEMGKDLVGRRRKAVPMIERALLLDRVAVLHPRGVTERRDVALERLGHAGLEEIVDHDVRKRLRRGEGAAQSLPVDVGPEHVEARL